MRFLANENFPLDYWHYLISVKAPSGVVVAQKVVKAIAIGDDWYGHCSVIEDEKMRMRHLNSL